MAVIDTSASLTDEMLEASNAELSRLAADYRVTVVECDSEIQNVYRYRKIDTVCGRGGTDFRPPLLPAFLRRHNCDLVVYFTDGYGPAPQKAPRVPVVWCLVAGGMKPASWGKVIWMEN
jgi:predicted metal-dependent peptidase